MRATRAAFLLAGLAALALVGWRADRGATVPLRPGQDITGAIMDAGPGARLLLLPGSYRPFDVGTEVALEASPGAVVRGPVRVTADGAQLRGLDIEGGRSGIQIARVDSVTIEDVRIVGTELHGIEVEAGSARIEGCAVSGLRSPYARGIAIRNSNGHPRSVIRGCEVSSGQEGLVSHVSRVEFVDNSVVGTSLRGIAVNEMSEGMVTGNRVTDGLGIGIYCGDMSHCDVRGNEVSGIEADAGVRSRAGYGIVAHYHSLLRAEDNRFDVASPQPVGLFHQSNLVERFPLSIWPPGWRGAVPALWVSAIWIAGMGLVRLLTGAVLRKRNRVAPRPKASTVAVAVLAGGFAAQSFHMLEHFVQVFQVYVAETEIRSGLAGQVVDTEWVHFAYNAGVLAFLIWAWRLVRPGAPMASTAGESGIAWLAAAIVVQGYHMVEHSAKMVQHLATGVDPAPGLLGGPAGLVWFHFGINLAVYVAMAVPLVRVLRSSVEEGGRRRILRPLAR